MQLFNLGIKNTSTPDSWYELTVLAFYRLFLSVALFSAFYFKLPPTFLGSSDAELYLSISVLYVFVASVLLILTSKRSGQFASQATIQLIIDIAIIIIIIRTSGGLTTGIGSLLVVVVVAGGALIPGRLAGFVAAIATLAVLLEAVYSQITGDGIIRYSHAGLLGATFFATALMAQVLARRLRKSQQLAEQHADDASKLTMLNKHIIERLQLGVMIVDKNNIVYSTNQSAQVLLGVSDSINGESLYMQVPELFGQLGHWRQGRVDATHEFQPQPGFAEVLPQMIKLEDGDTLIFLNDTSELTQQAQQMKLASLGRMAASIAHEVRNPLGAINHAAELLNEAETIDDKDKKLLDIIQRQSDRVNGIIDTVLQLSRRKVLNKSTFLLSLWLESFVDEFCNNEDIPKSAISLNTVVPLSQVRVDQEQLRQIMVNLCGNAWHYSESSLATSEVPQVLVRMGIENDEIIIDVLDNGPGVSETALPQLFEPFYSERTGGIGLGLFLAREMAQANGLRLNYIAKQDSKGFFRVTFNSEQQRKV